MEALLRIAEEVVDRLKVTDRVVLSFDSGDERTSKGPTLLEHIVRLREEQHGIPLEVPYQSFMSVKFIRFTDMKGVELAKKADVEKALAMPGARLRGAVVDVPNTKTFNPDLGRSPEEIIKDKMERKAEARRK